MDGRPDLITLHLKSVGVSPATPAYAVASTVLISSVRWCQQPTEEISPQKSL